MQLQSRQLSWLDAVLGCDVATLAMSASVPRHRDRRPKVLAFVHVVVVVLAVLGLDQRTEGIGHIRKNNRRDLANPVSILVYVSVSNTQLT